VSGDPRRARRAVARRLLLLGAGALSSHLLYPVALAAAARGRRPPTPPEPQKWPEVTVVIAAYREAGAIGRKIRSVLADGYPGALRVLVVADGDPATAAAARREGAEVLTSPERLGKSAALNLALAECLTEVVVLTDGNNPLRPGSIAAMVRWFDDPTVGAVAGAKSDRADAAEGLYYRYENHLKVLESRLGSTIGLVGELAAIRTSLWRPIPDHVANDDMWVALCLLARHYRIQYEDGALSYEEERLPLRPLWRRRSRIVTSQLQVLWEWRRLAGPARPEIALQVWGHRLWRTTFGPFFHLLLLGSLIRNAPRSRLAAAGLAAHVVAAGAVVRPPRGSGPLAALLRVARQLLLLHAVSVHAWLRVARGDRATKWRKPDR
jgi:glycosyltransferase involved in cell wall biosynthesis